MEIDPRLHPERETSSSDGAEPATEYPEPPSQYSAPQQGPSTNGPNFHGTRPLTQSAHVPYQGDSSSTLRASPRLDPSEPNDPYSDLKRPRACEACRQLKVRCEPDLVNPEGSCKRCAKAKRTCIVTVPTRKRQKKTDSRVTELERKIDALTASLQASQNIDRLLPSRSSRSPRDEPVGRRWLASGQASSNGSGPSGTPSNQAGSKRRHDGEAQESWDTGRVMTHLYAPLASPTREQNVDTTGKQWRPSVSSSTSSAKEAASRAPDIIDSGLVSPAVALQAFTRFVENMSGHIPIVVFPAGTQMSEVRKSKPVLFHAIVAVAVGPFQPSAQLPVLTELYKTIAERVIVKGEKSLDLVQALLVSCTFYAPPDNFEEIKFYQLGQLAVAVGMDIGMYRKPSSKAKPFNFLREVMKHSPATDPDSPEVRRAWLGCYFISTQTSTALRRPILVRWNPYMDECIEILEKSPDALPSDKLMIQWAKLVRIVEEISLQFFSEDQGTTSFSEPKFQFTFKAFEKQLEQWRKETFPNHHSSLIAQAEAIVNIYLHDSAMNIDFGNDDNKTLNTDISNPATAALISSLSTTLTSIHRAIDIICSVDIKDLANLPTLYLARSSFAVVALIKLYSIVTAPDSHIGQVIEPSNLKVEHYLDKVVEHYTAAGELPGALAPAKFANVMTILREWFRSRKDKNLTEAFHCSRTPGGNVSGSDQERNQNTNNIPNTNPNIDKNTPLHLLSEVAMTEPKNQPATLNQNTPLQQQQQTPYPPRPGFSTTDPISQPPSTQELAASQCLNTPPDLCPGATPCPGTTTIPTATTTAPTATSEPWVQYAPQRPFFPSPYNSTQQQGTGYSDPSGSGPGPSGGSSDAGMMMPSASAIAAQGIFVPELGIQVGYDPENLFALGNMLGDGVFNLPLPADLGMGFF